MVSLLTDIASEMLYPIMPVFLQSIGFSVLWIGLLEGLAEAMAGLSKGYFGKLSDHLGRRVPFVRTGYAFSAVSKPMMGLLIAPLWIFFARTLDRLGKGIRTGARDAMLAAEANEGTRGRIFGFHRSMDTLGAVLGPILALLYLTAYPGAYRSLFVVAFIPGVMAIAATWLLSEPGKKIPGRQKPPPLFSFLNYRKQGSIEYRRLLTGLLLFALFNSSDLFLLLRAKEAGLDDRLLILVYVFYNLVYALTAYPLGILADRAGLKKIFIAGLILFSLVYFGMSINGAPVYYFVLFFFYGLYAAATEGVARAWISQVTPKNEVATAIGTYTGFQSICTLLASTLAGFIWYRFGAPAVFIMSGIAGMGVVIYLAFRMNNERKST